MTLLRIDDKEFLPMPVILRLALQFVYDKDRMTLSNVHRLENTIMKWSEYFENKKSSGINLSAVDAENLFQLEGIAWLLRENDMGHLEQRKEMFKRHGIDYRKFYRLPEAYKKEDFERARAIIKESDKREGISYEN